MPLIRRSTDNDIPAMTEIYAHHVRHGTASFETEAPDATEMAARRDHNIGKGFPWLVAEDAGVVIGYAYVGPYRARLAYRHTVENSIYIHHEHAGKGIGSLLMPALITACEKNGYRQIVAVIGDSANAASINLHRKFGFRNVGVLKDVGFKFDRWLDTVFMQKALG
jgi:phosphinothricin acetyltransferase